MKNLFITQSPPELVKVAKNFLSKYGKVDVIQGAFCPLVVVRTKYYNISITANSISSLGELSNISIIIQPVCNAMLKQPPMYGYGLPYFIQCDDIKLFENALLLAKAESKIWAEIAGTLDNDITTYKKLVKLNAIDSISRTGMLSSYFHNLALSLLPKLKTVKDVYHLANSKYDWKGLCKHFGVKPNIQLHWQWIYCDKKLLVKYDNLCYFYQIDKKEFKRIEPLIKKNDSIPLTSLDNYGRNIIFLKV